MLIRHVKQLEGPYIFFGITGSSTAFISFLWKPIAGRMSEEKGTKQLLFWCLFGGLIGTIISAISGSLYLLYFGRLIAALSSPVQVLLHTSISNLDKENHAKHISRLGITGSLVGVVSAILSGHLLELQNGILYIYAVMIINSIINVVLSTCLPITDQEISERVITTSPIERAFGELKIALNNLKNTSTSDAYWDVFLIKAFIALSFSTIDSNCVIIFNSIGISQKNVAYMFVGILGTSIISNIYLIKVNQRYYKNDIGYNRILHAEFVLIILCLISAFSSNIFIFISLFFLMVTARVQIDNTVMELLMHKIDTGEKAVVLGCFESLLSLTDLISPIVSSLTLEFAGIPYVFILSSIFVTISSSVIVKVKYIQTADLKKDS